MTTTTTAGLFADENECPILTLEEVVYLAKLAKKDKKLSRILRILLDDVDIELPF